MTVTCPTHGGGGKAGSDPGAGGFRKAQFYLATPDGNTPEV